MNKPKNPKSPKILPCCFSTNVHLVDDHQEFLTTLHSSLDPASHAYSLWTNPEEALKAINEEPPSPFTPYFKAATLDDYDKSILEFDITQLHHLANDPNRFALTTTVVVDYSMPQMSGLEFLAQLQSPSIKKVLLTGVADQDIAINAFNQGLIDRFVVKSKPDANYRLEDEVDQHLEELKYEYFTSLFSQFALNESMDLLSDPQFETLFTQIVNDKRIVEYYQCDHKGCFYLRDGEQNTWLLFLADDDYIESCKDILNTEDVDAELSTKLDSKEHLFVFHSTYHEALPEPDEVAQYCHVATPITIDGSPHYWALVHLGK